MSDDERVRCFFDFSFRSGHLFTKKGGSTASARLSTDWINKEEFYDQNKRS